MRLSSIFSVPSAIALAALLAGCYPPTQTEYSPTLAEQPQPVHFFYGTLIDRRAATFKYGNTAGFGAALLPTYPYLAGVTVSANGPTAGIGAAFGGTALLAAGTIPSLPATEYTVCLNRGTDPPDPYLPPGAPAAVVVVQNDYPDRYDYTNGRQNDLDMQPGTQVVVRVVGNSGRVMRRNPPWLLPQAPERVECGPADRPMPVPLGSQPPPPPQYSQVIGEEEVKDRVSQFVSGF
jgi:hypothetical protein